MIQVKNKIAKTQQMEIGKLWANLIKDERGGEVLEYAVVAGLITIASIGVIGKLGTKVLARWGSLNSSL